MDPNTKNVEALNIELTNEDINFKKYVIKNQITYYNTDNLIDKDNCEDLICVICLNVLKNPISCSEKKKYHSFCKECIDEYLKQNDYCPTCKENFEYKINNILIFELNKLHFKCAFQKEGCDCIISYSEYLSHINNCKYNDISYECHIMKYNYDYKEFEKCGYIGKKLDIQKHFKLCAYNKYNCIFCNKDILQMNLEEHAKNECKFGIIIYPEGNTYIGDKQKNMRQGYEILYYSDDDRYEGEWKNNIQEGYGIYYYSDDDRYEGEWKNGIKEGYGILYHSDDDKYEGEWKDDIQEGYGIYFFSSGDRYEGEWKNNTREGYGLYFYSNGRRYEGEWKNNKREGRIWKNL